MLSLGFGAALSFLFALLLTPLLRDALVARGLVDKPDGRRKLHQRTVPRLGGVAVVAAYALTYVVLLFSPLPESGLLQSHARLIWSLLPAVLAVFLTGLADDLFDLNPGMKLAGQIAAGLLAYSGGVRIASIAGFSLAGWLAPVVTVAWLVLASNAFNLIDGVDGLATGVGILASVTTCLAGLLHGDAALALATVPLIGALLGFLRYNFNPASIFLGDCGSLFIGFLLGCYGVIWSQKSATMFGMAAPLMALALPLLDVGLSIARRFLSSEPIFGSDRGHIHHRLLERGFTPKGVALLLYGACGLGAALSLLQSVLQNSFGGLLLVLFGGVVFIGVQYLGYVEFEATRRFLVIGLRPMLRAHVKLEIFERRLLRAQSIDECWEAVQAAGRDLGYSRLQARLGGERFGKLPPHGIDAAFWQMRVNLAGGDFVNITQHAQPAGSAEKPILVVPFAAAISKLLPEKIRELAGRPRTQLVVALWNSTTTTVMSSDCAAPSVNAATAS